jgi:hypothetical protein
MYCYSFITLRRLLRRWLRKLGLEWLNSKRQYYDLTNEKISEKPLIGPYWTNGRGELRLLDERAAKSCDQVYVAIGRYFYPEFHSGIAITPTIYHSHCYTFAKMAENVIMELPVWGQILYRNRWPAGEAKLKAQPAASTFKSMVELRWK